MNQQAYQIERDKRVLVARPTRSECSGSDIAALIVELCQRINEGEADSVVIELSNVQHMDSACIGKLLGLRGHTHVVGGSVALAGCQPNVEFLFKMTRLDKVFGIYASTELAVAELRERRTRPKPAALEDESADGHRNRQYAPLLNALLRAHQRRRAHAGDLRQHGA